MKTPHRGSEAQRPEREILKGRILLNTGGKLVADKTRASLGMYIAYIPKGEKFVVGYKNALGTFVPVTEQYTAVALTGKCFCKVRMRIRPSVPTLSSGVDLAPTAMPAKSERYLEGKVYLRDGDKVTPAIKVGTDVLDLSDQATAVAAAGKCVLEVRVKVLASKEVPPEPETFDEGEPDPYIPPPKYSVPPDDDPPPWEV